MHPSRPCIRSGTGAPVGLAQLGCDSGRGGTQSFCHLEPGAGFFGKIRFWDPYVGNGARPRTTGERNLSTPNAPQWPD